MSHQSLDRHGRRGRFALSVMLCLIFSGCSHRASLDPPAAPTRPPLNSERIEARFGSYGIELLPGAGPLRVANLFSVHGDGRTCRTFAVTAFPEFIDPRLEALHREILAGGSIGATLKAAGWRVTKRPLGIGELSPRESLDAVYALMGVPPEFLAYKVYDLYASNAAASTRYATITELYHPDYLSLESLADVEGPDADPGRLQLLLSQVEAAARDLPMKAPFG